MHTDGAAPRWVVTGPAGQRDYELMGLGCRSAVCAACAAVCCTGLNPEGQSGGLESARTTAACHARVGALG